MRPGMGAAVLARDHMANGEPSWRFPVPDAANEVPDMGELLGDIRSMDPQSGNYREVKRRRRVADKPARDLWRTCRAMLEEPERVRPALSTDEVRTLLFKTRGVLNVQGA